MAAIGFDIGSLLHTGGPVEHCGHPLLEHREITSEIFRTFGNDGFF
jgi:hypothetical protein